jgi:hypothetical protein
LKIHIYTDIDTLFGRAARLWMDVLVTAGHNVEFVDLGTSTDSPLPELGHCDLNLLIVGIYAFERFGKHGLPAHGKNLQWMLDPLTADPQATVHGHKAQLFDTFAGGLDAVIAMDEPIEAYLVKHYPALAVTRIPYLVAEKNIRVPEPEATRSGGAIFIGNSSPNRERAQRLFEQAGVAVDFVWRGLWGAERERRLADARLALCIHADVQHTYFDQFLTLEAWAAGTVVLAEGTSHHNESSGMTAHGIESGRHLAVARLKDMPAICRQLLEDAPARQQMLLASQQMLREHFSPLKWTSQMLAVVDATR